MPSSAISRWLTASLQPVTYLGIAMLLCIYVMLTYLIIEDQKAAEQDAIRNSENIVVLFEQSIFRAFKGVDDRLTLVRNFYQKDPSGINLSDLLDESGQSSDLTFQYTIAGPNGFIQAATVGGPNIGFYVGDRVPFIAHANSTEDKLFISEPTVLHASGRRGLVLTRRISGPDGSFQGAIAATIDLTQFERFYQKMDLGKDGLASLWGLDGIIRVAGANGKLRPDLVGKRFPKAGMYAYLKESLSGTYWNTPKSPAKTRRMDQVKRLVTYRKVTDFPLIVALGKSETAVFAHAHRNAVSYWGISGILTAGIIFAIGFGARRQYKLDETSANLARTSARFSAAIENMPHGLSMISADRRLVVSNSRYSTMYGLDPDQTAPGTPLNAIFRRRVAGADPAQAKQYIDSIVEAIDRRQPSETVTQLPNGRTILISHQPMSDGGAVAIHQDITEQKQAEQKIWRLAHHDSLTGLPNRLAFLGATKEAVEHRQNGDQTFAIFLLDIDRFKEINDSLGHPIGDALLQAVGQRLKSAFGEDVLVARLGGDEFAILHPSADVATAHSAARNLQWLIERPFDIEYNQLYVEASIGIAHAPEHGLDSDELIKKADLALYTAKADGRRGYRIFDPGMAETAVFRHTLVNDLRRSIDEGNFEVHYQPIVNAATLDVVSMEALVRWPHPQRGLVNPDKFIPLAEETGLIKPLGDWILRRACKEAATWENPVKVAVNLSPIQFRSNNLVDQVTSALTESGLPAERLELEVTESILLDHDDENLAILRKLQHLGISIALDDFGTGYSSLGYLRQFPFNKIKIDRLFITELGQCPDCAAIVSAIAGLTRHLDITLVAEGVETDEHLVLLRAVGCEQVQGYLFGRPSRKPRLILAEDAKIALSNAG